MEHSGDGKSAWGTKVKTSGGRKWGWNTIYGRAGEHSLPYMTRVWIGRLRFHLFHRGDNDPDHHDHPWDFWTFPFTSYVEEVVEERTEYVPFDDEFATVGGTPVKHHVVRRQVVPAWRLTYRSAVHCHRVLGRYSGNVRDPFNEIVPCSAARAATLPSNFEPYYDARKIATVVWRGKDGRKWGFLKYRDGRYCWIHWKEYVFGDGKDAPCGE